jgi:hypothetical protein
MDGEPMNAILDYVIRMAGDGMPPTTAFSSIMPQYGEQRR